MHRQDGAKFKNVELATVRLPSLRGQGVLVSGGIVLTAAHCVEYGGKGLLGPDTLVPMVTGSGSSITGQLLAIEEFSDVAAVSVRDPMKYDCTNDPFEKFVEETAGIKVCWKEIETNESISVRILTHNKGWIRGETRITHADGPLLAIVTEEAIEGGTSGGPVVNDAGELVGVVSNGTYTNHCPGLTPQICLALPVWVCRRIRESEDSEC